MVYFLEKLEQYFFIENEFNKFKEGIYCILNKQTIK